MTDPGSPDDSWDELARELGVKKTSPSAEKATSSAHSLPDRVEEDRPVRDLHPPEDLAGEPADADDFGSLPESMDEADSGQEIGEGPEGEGGEGAAGEDQPGEGQPGTGRKRRRRRRRRKKGGAAAQESAGAGEPAEGEGAEGEAEESVAPVGVPARARRGEPEEPVADDEGWDTEEEPSGVPLAAEEDTGGEVLRDLIASWNVPSWDEIVGGLYRPER